MTILHKDDLPVNTPWEGVSSRTLLDSDAGTSSLTMGELTMEHGSDVPTHVHSTEEGMVILEGDLEAVLGDEVVNVKAGHILLAPAGVRHGFANRSGSSARVITGFPTGKRDITFVD
jgi:quercetin dioxygenase-like cupin family protein